MIRLILGATVITLLCTAANAAPIHDAAAKGDIAKVTAMLKQNPALLNLGDKDGATPLHHAAAKGWDAVVNYLIEQKANLNVKKRDGVTPLHVAAGTGQKSVVELLLTAGADANVTDKKGRTPLSLAQQRNYPEIVRLIEEHLKPIQTVKGIPPKVIKSPGGPEPPPTPQRNYEALSRRMIELAAKGDFAGVERMFDENLRAKMPAALMQTQWKSFVAQAGQFINVTGLRQSNEQGSDVVYATLQFEKASGDVKLVFNSAGRLADFQILLPATAK